MKRLLSLIALFILIMSMLCVNSFFSKKLDSNDIKVTVNFGYNRNIAVSEKWIPVTITLENKTNDTIEGDLVLNFVDDMKKTSMPFVLPGKVEKNTTMYVFYSGESRYKVSLLSKKGSVMYETSVRTFNSTSYEASRNNLIGVMTDNTDSINYILQLDNLEFGKYASQMGFQYTSSRIKVDVLDSKSFPISKDAIGSFSALIINDFDLSSLTSEQKAIFDYYIQTGGTVIFGTGLEASYAYAGMDKYVSPKLKEPIAKRINLAAHSSANGINLHITEVEDENLSFISNKKYPKLAYKHNDYNLYYLTFGLNEPDFVNWAGNYEYIFEFLLDNTNALKGVDDSGMPYYSAESLSNILGFASKNFVPSLLLIVFIVFLYLIVVGPVTYAILKKKDKRELMWIAIPVIVVVFSVTIFMYGYVSRGGGNAASCLTIVELNPYSELQKPAYITTSVMTSSSGDYDVSLGNNALFGSQMFNKRNYYYSGENNMSLAFAQGEKSKVTVNGATMWSFINAEANKEVKNYGSIESDIKIEENGRFTVKLKNNTGHDLEYVVVTVLDDIRPINEFKYLDTVEFSFRITSRLNNSYYNNIITELNQLFNRKNQNGGSYYYGNSMYVGALIQDLGRDKALQASILSEFLLSKAGGQEFSLTPQLHVVGFVKNADKTDILVNGRKPSKNWDRTLVYQSIDIGISTGGDVNSSFFVPTFVPELSKGCEETNDMVLVNGKDSYAFYEVVVPAEFVLTHQLVLKFKTKDDVNLSINNINESGDKLGYVINGTGLTASIKDLLYTDYSIIDSSGKNQYGEHKFIYFRVEIAGEEKKVLIEDVEYTFTPNID